MTKKEQIDALILQGKTSIEISKLLGFNISVVRYWREASKHGSRNKISSRIAEHRRKLKRKGICYSGSKCLKCGYNSCDDVLAFHHLDPSQKEYGLGHGKTNSWDKFKEEADKTILLCHNCHSELHAGIWSPSVEMVKLQNDIRASYQDKELFWYSDMPHINTETNGRKRNS